MKKFSATSVVQILSMRAPLEVFSPVVLFVFVEVVYFEFLVRLRFYAERICYKPVDTILSVFTVQPDVHV